MLPVIKNLRKNQNLWFPTIFDDFFNDEFMPVSASKRFARPAVNIKENEKNYDIEVAAPGMTKDEFKLNITANHELEIALERKDETEQKDEEKGTWLRREFSYSSFAQRFAIPEDVEIEKIEAKMDNGVLNINLPKKEIVNKQHETRQIEIR